MTEAAEGAAPRHAKSGTDPDALDRSGAKLGSLRASAYRIPTDTPEADGTFAWHATTLVIVELTSKGITGLGYTYSDPSLVPLIDGTLAPVLADTELDDIGTVHARMQHQVRNLGRSGLAATAISAIDCALWDWQARRLNVPLAALLGQRRERVAVYGSGGFTTYDDARLREQLGKWVHEDGCRWVKLKVGSDPRRDPERVRVSREAIGNDAGLFVDANGAFDRDTALHYAQRFAESNVMWFEEPVSSDDVEGLASIRARAPAGMAIAAGEYGYIVDDFRRLLKRQAVDVLQADLTRCGGVTGFMQVAALADAFHIPLSAHCAPALHLHVACAALRLRHQEWFHDHVRIESMLFDGAPRVVKGEIAPDLSRAGNGLEFKVQDAGRYKVA
ncbi:L-talarate/galactarate dehydratase (plasmid) [Pararobbsia alpina]|uniref:enolase C-terminal domain-like protein n=1 Tax=Pararobbsia alpina TaxID=621374 RepID=UPI0039A623ED